MPKQPTSKSTIEAAEIRVYHNRVSVNILRRLGKANGDKLKRLSHKISGLTADLYITDADRWGMIATIRTGSAEFNVELMRYIKSRDMENCEGLLYRVNRDGSRTPLHTSEERDVFSAIGLPLIQPRERTPENLRAIINSIR